jgi:predicted DNA-binding transcriptional regulator AlpA
MTRPSFDNGFSGLAPACLDPTPPGPVPAKLLLSAREGAALCGVSLRQWWRWDASGSVPRAAVIGRTKRWVADELRRWTVAGCPDRQTWEMMRDT